MKHIVHRGKHDQIVIDDGKDRTPEEELGEQMREHRADMGYLLREMATVLEVTPRYLSDAENGRLSMGETKAMHARVFEQEPKPS